MIHAELAYFVTLFNTTPCKLVWCYAGIPRAEYMSQCGLKDTIYIGAEAVASPDFAQRKKDLCLVNDAIEASSGCSR